MKDIWILRIKLLTLKKLHMHNMHTLLKQNSLSYYLTAVFNVKTTDINKIGQ